MSSQAGTTQRSLPEPISLETFVDMLRTMRGTVLRSLRLDFDLAATGAAAKSDLERVCAFLDQQHSFDRLWANFMLAGSNRVTVDVLSKEEAANVQKLMQLAEGRGWDITELWTQLGGTAGEAMRPGDFVQGLRGLGFDGDALLLYNGLDVSGQDRLWQDEFEYAQLVHASLRGRFRARQPPRRDGPGGARGRAPETTKEEREAAAEFARWALSRWKLVAEVFLVGQDRDAKHYRAVRTEDFARWLRTTGFPGDGLAVAREVQRVCHRQGGRWGLPAEEAGHATGETISMPQVQCYRKCRGVTVRRMLVNTLRERRGCGSVVRSWRFDLDKDGNGQVGKDEFERACSVLGCASDFGVIWQALRPDGEQDPLELWDLAPEEALDLTTFGALLLRLSGFDLHKAWQLLDPHRLGQVELESFRSKLEEMGFDGDIDRLFKGLDGSGHGVLWPDSLEIAWVATLLGAAPPPKKGAAAPRRGGPEPAQPLALEVLVEKLDLQKPGSSVAWDREVERRLEKLGYHGTVARIAGKIVRATLRKSNATAVFGQSSKKGPAEKPEWDFSNVPNRCPRPFPPAAGLRHLAQMHAAPDNLFGATFLPLTA